MALDLSPDVLVRAGSGGLLLLLGVLVALLRPRTRASVSFAWFSASFGLQFVVANGAVALGAGHPARGPLLWTGSALFLAATAALAVFAAAFPPRPRQDGYLGRFLASGVAGVHAGAGLLVLFGTFGDVAPWSEGIAEEVGEAPNRAFVLVFQLLLGILFASLVLFALRYRRSIHHAPGHARAMLLVSGALLLYPAYNVGASLLRGGIVGGRGAGVADGGTAIFLLQGWLGLGSCVLIMAIWLANISGSPHSRGCRNLALAALAIPLAAFLVERWDLLSGAGVGYMRVVSVALIGYAVVRRQLFDLDLKVKWTLRQSTVVGAFAAAFFVVSELATALLTPALGTILGIAAAGALVFAISPLQRLAERVSDRAMPGVADTAEYRLVRKREVYRAAAESAAFDGTITEKDRDMLATLADQLGLKATDARGIEREVHASFQRTA